MNIYGVGFNSDKGLKADIYDIIDQITTFGVQRANRFSVGFENCPVDVLNTQTNDYTFFATMCQLPERSIQYYQDSVGPFSPPWDIPLKNKFDENYIITFLVEERWTIRTLIESWMDYISGRMFPGGFVTGLDTRNAKILSSAPGNDSANDSSKIIIKGFRTRDNGIGGKLTLYGAWPKAILPTNMDTNMNNMPLTMSVVFGYRYYRFTQG